MTNREIILQCLKENTDVTCRKSPCDKPEQEGNARECCDNCALGILEEYEREVRSNAIDDFCETMDNEMFSTEWVKIIYHTIAEKLKEGSANELK